MPAVEHEHCRVLLEPVRDVVHCLPWPTVAKGGAITDSTGWSKTSG